MRLLAPSGRVMRALQKINHSLVELNAFEVQRGTAAVVFNR